MDDRPQGHQVTTVEKGNSYSKQHLRCPPTFPQTAVSPSPTHPTFPICPQDPYPPVVQKYIVDTCIHPSIDTYRHKHTHTHTLTKAMLFLLTGCQLSVRSRTRSMEAGPADRYSER